MQTSQKTHIIRWAVLAAVVVVLVFLYNINPAESVAAPKCLVKMVTGYDCPGCGFQRAVHALLHGHFVQAARFNFFLLLALPYLLALFVSDYCLRGETQRRWQRVTHSMVLILTYLVLYLVWWVVRNIYHL